MKRFLALSALIAFTMAPGAVHASPFAFQQSAVYPTHLWFTIDKLKADAAANNPASVSEDKE